MERYVRELVEAELATAHGIELMAHANWEYGYMFLGRTGTPVADYKAQ